MKYLFAIVQRVAKQVREEMKADRGKQQLSHAWQPCWRVGVLQDKDVRKRLGLRGVRESAPNRSQPAEVT